MEKKILRDAEDVYGGGDQLKSFDRTKLGIFEQKIFVLLALNVWIEIWYWSVKKGQEKIS